jgi:hypothetical protein
MLQPAHTRLTARCCSPGCGFLLWPSESTLPDGSPYGYGVGAVANNSAVFPRNVLREFVDAADVAGVGYGFYYSIMKSFYLCHSFSGKNSCGTTLLPGQHNFSDAQYADIVKQQVTELWTEYGNLTEIWVDSGLGASADLMVKLQPQAVGTPANPTMWCGTESGHPSHDVGGQDVWSTGGGYHGDPESSQWMPKFCDPQVRCRAWRRELLHTPCMLRVLPFAGGLQHGRRACNHIDTSIASPHPRALLLLHSPKTALLTALQHANASRLRPLPHPQTRHHPPLTRKPSGPQLFQEHVWFWEPNLKVRTLAMLIPIYHDIVGRGMVMELAFSIDRDGLVEDTHAAVYQQLGDWVRHCYGQPVAETTVAAAGSGGGTWVYELRVPAGAVFDRVQLREETVEGQRVRQYNVVVSGAASDGAVASASGSSVQQVVAGQAIGTKRILLLGQNFTAAAAGTVVRLTVTASIAPPVLRQFAVFAPCPDQ